MIKWEYCEMDVSIGGPLTGVTAKVTFFKVDGKADTWQGNYTEGMARLGMNGWEMVGSSARIAAGLTGNHKINYIFKRELVESS